ncbi:MAG: methylamine utilization protein MauE [Proteobacteria bacterium]|nr:methylamine utilization protein MauE [Pseudomonadota bacterium]
MTAVPPALDPGFGLLLVAAFALLFGEAGWAKARARAEFAAVLANYRLLPRLLVPPLSFAVPALELGVAIALWFPATRPRAALAGAALLLVYAAAILVNLARGRRDLDCGCAGPAERRPIASWMVVRNLLLATLLAVAALPWGARPLEAVDALTAVAGLAVAVCLYLALDRLLGVIAPRAAALRGAR